MTRILRYILQHDTGMAPCIDDGLVSLATCKPRVRASGRPGEWVAGFRPGRDRRGLLVWAGRIADSLDVGEYERRYSCKRRGGRADAVYRARSQGGFQRLRPDYHPDAAEFRKDTGSPVLIFDRSATWYFGQNPRLLPEHLMHLAASGRGHRVSGAAEGDAAALLEWLLGEAPPGVHGLPRDASPIKRRRCGCG